MIINLQAGCLFPSLILINFFFGWIFLDIKIWLLSEAILVLLFLLNCYVLIRKVRKFSRGNNVIDVEGEVVQEKKHHKELK
jgi:hypothetical protein